MKARLRDLQSMDYKACWDLQQELFEAMLAQKMAGVESASQNNGVTAAGDAAGTVARGAAEKVAGDAAEKDPDQAGTILVVEHPPVYTLGKSGHTENLFLSREALEKLGAQFFHIDRGGDITFHGPGQLVVYPLLDLERLGIGLRQYIEALEEAVIRVAAEYGIRAGRIAGASGVWITGSRIAEQVSKGVFGEKPEATQQAANQVATGQHGGMPRKLCAIGVRSSRYVTMHGLALNVATDLRWFTHMNPCGFSDRGVTSLERETGREVPMDEVKTLVVKFLEEELNVRIYK